MTSTAFLRLDLTALRVNVWPIIFMSVLVTTMTWISGGQEPLGLAAIVPLLPVFYVTYPFLNDERGRHDLLYATLPLRRRTVVLSRHLLQLALQLGAAVIAVALMLAASAATGRPLDPSLTTLTILLSLAAGSVLLALQIPVLFGLGFAKARWVTLVPVVGFLAPIALLQLPSQRPNLASLDLVANTSELLPMLAPALVAVIALAWTASATISTKLYARRQF
jgi:hypothetical protein